MEKNNQVIKIGGINITARVKNPTFWISTFGAVIAMWAAYFNMSPVDITTFDIAWDIFKKGMQNPVLITSTLGIFFNAIVDTTTVGFSDIAKVLEYTKPKSDK